MADKDQEEKLNSIQDEATEISDEQLDGIAGGRWRMHPPTERERLRYKAMKRRNAGQTGETGETGETDETEDPEDLLDY